MLLTISNLNIHVRPQSKLLVLRKYIPAQVSFDLQTNDISLTWIDQHLDNQIANSVRFWLELPISTCVAELLTLTINKGGYGIP